MYLKLLLSFSYIGAFTFGGGYSMLPMFQRVLVEKNKWVTEDEVTDLFSISQCLPGIIAANTAVFVGYKVKGIIGGIVAALGVVLPSLVIIMLIAAFISNFADIEIVQKAFIGLRICVSVLIINAVYKLSKHAIVDWAAALIFVAVFVISVFFNVHVAFLILAAGICGIAISLIRKNIGTSGGDEAPPDENNTPPDESEAPDENKTPPSGGAE